MSQQTEAIENSTQNIQVIASAFQETNSVIDVVKQSVQDLEIKLNKLKTLIDRFKV